MAVIERVDLLMLDLPPKVVRTDAIQSFVSQETPIVRITTDDGAVGTGGPAVMALLAHTLAPRLIGRDAGMVEQIWRDLYFATHATTVGAITSLALAAIDTALWDLRCRHAGQPLHQLAGGAQASVPLYTTEGGWLHIAQEALIEDALHAQAACLGGAKIKVGRPIAEDVARLEAVRAEVGPDFALMVDANQAFTVDDALRRAVAYAPLGLAWFEEPLPADDVAGHCALAQTGRIPVAVGESLYGLAHFRDYLARGACHVVQVDAARIGGITPWLKVAHLAEAFNLPVAPHFLMELHVALAAAVPNGRWVEHIPQLDAITTQAMRIEAGRAIPNPAPGLGIDWDWERIRSLTVPGSATIVTG